MRFSRKTRPRIDKPQRKTQTAAGPKSGFGPTAPVPVATTYWERLDQKLQWVLEGAPVYWKREPNPHQLMLFCRTIDELRTQVEAEGLEP